MSLTPKEWAAVLKDSWDQRAASPERDFYIASINDPERWKAQGEVDARLMLHGLDPAFLADAEVLEIGCGVGRLAGPLLKHVADYTGFDISQGMVMEARRRCEDLSRARFFPSDGTSVPPEARDKQYHLAIALAVFIHCPKSVTASLIESAYACLRPAGQLRFQLLADPEDPTGVEPSEQVETAHQQSVEMERGATPEQLALIENHYYMGDAYQYDEVLPWLTDLTGGKVQLFRPDLGHIYGWIERG